MWKSVIILCTALFAVSNCSLTNNTLFKSLYDGKKTILLTKLSIKQEKLIEVKTMALEIKEKINEDLAEFQIKAEEDYEFVTKQMEADLDEATSRICSSHLVNLQSDKHKSINNSLSCVNRILKAELSLVNRIEDRITIAESKIESAIEGIEKCDANAYNIAGKTCLLRIFTNMVSISVDVTQTIPLKYALRVKHFFQRKALNACRTAKAVGSLFSSNLDQFKKCLKKKIF